MFLLVALVLWYLAKLADVLTFFSDAMPQRNVMLKLGSDVDQKQKYFLTRYKL